MNYLHSSIDPGLLLLGEDGSGVGTYRIVMMSPEDETHSPSGVYEENDSGLPGGVWK